MTPATEIRGRLLDANDVAARLNVSKASVYRWVHHCGLPALQFGPRGSLRISEIDLEMWIAAQRKDAND